MVLILEDLTRACIGAFYRTYDRLGYGFLETIYVGALVMELERLGLSVEREVAIEARYDGEVLGSYRADLLVNKQLIIEVKAGQGAIGIFERQLLNYLRCSDLEVGLLFVFGVKPEFRRLVHSRQYKQKPR